MKEKIKKGSEKALQSEKVRFGAVGVVNTAVDFVVLNILVSVFGVPPVVSNIISTTAALLTSFTLNKKAVFRSSDGNHARQFIVFLAVTLTGIWLVQSGVLAIVIQLLKPLGLPDIVALNIAKLAGICFGLVWNYLWYSRVVFRQADASEK